MAGPASVRPGVAEVAGYFLRLGAFGFGGPVALTARMQRDLVDARGWFAEGDYLEGLAFAQLAPGPLAAQLAMYLGFVHGGIAGATLAGLAFVLPSFLIVVVISMAYVAYGGLASVQALFSGIGPVVIGIIAVAAGRLAAKVVKRDPLLTGVFAVVAVWTAVSQTELVGLFLAAGVLTLIARAPRRPRSAAPTPLVLAVPPVSPAGAGALPLIVFFAKAGLFVFGSGLAIVPFLYAGVVQDHRWLTDRQFLDAVAIAMITPGPVVITVAFIGYVVDGLTGAAAAGLGIFLPVYLMVIALAPVFRRYAQAPRVRAFVAGVTAAAAGAIAGSAFVLARRSIHDSPGVVVALLTLVVLIRWKVPEPALIAAGGLIGLAMHGAAL